MRDTMMSAGEREVRCLGCTTLLGLACGNELHVCYKEFELIARGAVAIRCRRCGDWRNTDPSATPAGLA